MKRQMGRLERPLVIEDIKVEAPVLGGVHDALRGVRGRSLLELLEEMLGKGNDYKNGSKDDVNKAFSYSDHFDPQNVSCAP